MPADWSRPVDVERLADAGETREFDLPLRELPRLLPSLAVADGSAHCRIVFARERGAPTATVAVQARLGLRCERCLRPVWLEVDDESSVWLVTDPAKADDLDPGIEPTLAPQGRVVLPITTSNHGRELVLSVDPNPVDLRGNVRIAAIGRGIDTITVFASGRVIGRISGPDGEVEVPAAKLGLGTVTLMAIGRDGAGPMQAVNAIPIAVDVRSGQSP